jgi:hypothetical protein
VTGPAEEVAEPQNEPEPDDKAATNWDTETVNYVENQMPSTMTIDTAIFGIHNGSVPRRTRATGRVMEGDIAEATTAYEPPDCYPEAESALRKDYAVVLSGPPGVGKRTAAFVLLRAVETGELVLLSPQVSIGELADRRYDKGTGYAVIDHIVDRNAGESEFSWRVLRERLAAAGSYLVLTTTTEPPAATDAVRRVQWAQPDVEFVLRRRMATQLAGDDWATLTGLLAGTTRIRDVVRLAERLDNGEPLETAVDHFDQTSRTAVSEWFNQEPSRRQITEVATLAFAHGSGDRTFESMLTAFERKLQVHMPEPESTEEVPSETSLPQRRRCLTGQGSLIVRRTVPSDLGPHGELVFASPGYYRHVLGQLWDRMEVAFWDAVRDWLDDTVTVDSLRVALGLARLAEISFDEVLALLERWSAGSRGIAGQGVSIRVLSWMALDELAPVALLTATRWINSGDAARRWTAAVALGADLGVRYPHDAFNRLWQLCTQAHTTTGDASVALAHLFVTLVRETPDAGIVLTNLAEKLGRFSRPSGNVKMHAVAVAAVLAVLRAHDPVSNRRSFLLYLEQFPERTDTVARLWAAVLRNRPTRLRAIEALQAALKDLAEHGGERPADHVRRLGAALAAAMTAADRAQLQLDMRRVADRRDAIGGEALAALLSALLKALDRSEPPNEEPS